MAYRNQLLDDQFKRPAMKVKAIRMTSWLTVRKLLRHALWPAGISMIVFGVFLWLSWPVESVWSSNAIQVASTVFGVLVALTMPGAVEAQIARIDERIARHIPNLDLAAEEALAMIKSDEKEDFYFVVIALCAELGIENKFRSRWIECIKNRSKRNTISFIVSRDNQLYASAVARMMGRETNGILGEAAIKGYRSLFQQQAFDMLCLDEAANPTPKQRVYLVDRDASDKRRGDKYRWFQAVVKYKKDPFPETENAAPGEPVEALVVLSRNQAQLAQRSGIAYHTRDAHLLQLIEIMVRLQDKELATEHRTRKQIDRDREVLGYFWNDIDFLNKKSDRNLEFNVDGVNYERPLTVMDPTKDKTFEATKIAVSKWDTNTAVLVDLCCGVGSFSILAIKAAKVSGANPPRVVLVDLDEEALKYAKTNLEKAGHPGAQVDCKLIDLNNDFDRKSLGLDASCGRVVFSLNPPLWPGSILGVYSPKEKCWREGSLKSVLANVAKQMQDNDELWLAYCNDLMLPPFDEVSEVVSVLGLNQQARHAEKSGAVVVYRKK